MTEPKLRFKSYQSNWNKVLLNDIVDITRLAGYEYTTYWQEDENEEVIALRGYNIGKSKLILKDLSYISHELSNQLIRSKLNVGDIVYPCVGTIGNAAVIEENNMYHIQQNIAKITPNKNIDSYFVAQFLMSESGAKQVAKFNASSGQPNVLVGSLRNFEVYIPSELGEQHKIGEFLSKIDKKIILLDEKYELLFKYKIGVMRQIFTRGVRFKNSSGNFFPEWKNNTLNQVSVCLDSRRKPLNESQRAGIVGNIPYWGANNIMGYVDKFIFDETIVLLAEDGGSFNDYSTKPIANLSKGKCWVNNHAHVLVGNDFCLTEFLYYVLVHKDITTFVSGGTRPKLTKGEMLKIPILTPSLDEQRLVVNFFSLLDERLALVKSQLESVKRYKQGLLQRMFI